MVVTSQKSWDMKINKIEITNFKGFQHESIQFHGNLTVVIGNNTAGKTTLLHAVQVGLGAYLQSLSDLPGGKPYRKNFVESDRFLKYNPNLKDYLPNKDLPRIDIDADFTPLPEFPVMALNSNQNPFLGIGSSPKAEARHTTRNVPDS